MVKKIKKYLKFAVCCALIMSLIAPSYEALSASDGSAFVTKAEFDAALADFNSRLTTFEAGINSKIDSQVTSYLDRNGIWNGKEQELALPDGRTVTGAPAHNLWYCDLLADYTREADSWTPQAYHFKNSSISWNTSDYGPDAGSYHMVLVTGGKSVSVKGRAQSTYPYLWKKFKYEYQTDMVSSISKSGLCCVDLTYGWYYNFRGRESAAFGLYDYWVDRTLYCDLNQESIDLGISAGNADYSGFRISHFATGNEHWQYPAYYLNYAFTAVSSGSTVETIKQQGNYFTWTAPNPNVVVYTTGAQEEETGFMLPSLNPTRAVYYFFVQKGDNVKYKVWDEFGGRWMNWGWSPNTSNTGRRLFIAQVNTAKVY